jgi:hypothetical protein
MGTGDIGVVDWGEYNFGHKYNFSYPVVASTDVRFLISDWFDDWYESPYDGQTAMADNEGALTLNVYECREVEPFSRHAEITSPDVDELISGNLDLQAFLIDDDFDNVQWAVRKDTCAASTNTVAGNVDGKSDSFSWVADLVDPNRYLFASTLDTLSWQDGNYCFVFNPVEDAGEADIRLTRWFYVDNTGPMFDFEDPTPEDESTIDGDSFKVRVEGTEIDWCEISLNDGPFSDMQRVPSGTIVPLTLSQVIGDFFEFEFGPLLKDGPYDYLVRCYDELGNPTEHGRRVTIYNQPDEGNGEGEDDEEGENEETGGDTGGGTILTPITILAPVAAAEEVEPEEEEEETEEVLGEEDEQKTEESEDVKGSSDTVCPWWWIVTLGLIIVNAFLGGAVKAANRDSKIKKYYYLWPAATGALAWILHHFLHADYAPTWFCNNYWLIAIVSFVVTAFLYRLLINKSEN